MYLYHRYIRCLTLILLFSASSCEERSQYDYLNPRPSDTHFTSFEEALRHPETAREIEIISAYPDDDSSLGSFDIPYSVHTLVNLESILIRGIRLGRVPISLCECRKLAFIEFTRAHLSSLPEALLCLGTSLHDLRLDENGISSIPPAIDSLRYLETLDLSHNHIDSLPESIGNLHILRWLHLDDNRLVVLPYSIGRLQFCNVLSVEHNELQIAPDSIGQLIRCQALFLGSNRLQTIPAAFGNLRRCQVLHLDSNLISSLPTQLGSMSSLDTLTLSGNPISIEEQQRIRAFMPTKTHIYF
jgi:Leucine-rich repeat (LRR) protein